MSQGYLLSAALRVREIGVSRMIHLGIHARFSYVQRARIRTRNDGWTSTESEIIKVFVLRAIMRACESTLTRVYELDDVSYRFFPPEIARNRSIATLEVSGYSRPGPSPFSPYSGGGGGGSLPRETRPLQAEPFAPLPFACARPCRRKCSMCDDGRTRCCLALVT